MSDPSGGLVLIDSVRPHVCVLTLNRPDKRNALNIPLLTEFADAMESMNRDPARRALIIAGAGPVFCAGLDLQEARDPEKSHQSGELVAKCLASIMTSPHVTIAAAKGAAVAGGAGFVLACDLAVVANDLRTGFPEVRRGLVAGLVMTFLRRKVPESKARELLLLGNLISGDEACASGMVNRAVPPDQVLDTALSLADDALKGAPMAILRTKRLFDELYDLSVAEHIDRALALHKDMRTSEEAQEGLAAYGEKRPPKWDPDAEA